jgi:integrase
MICSVFKKNHGNGRKSKTYYGKYKCDGMPQMVVVSLKTNDKRIALKHLNDIFNEAELKVNGLPSQKLFKECSKLSIIEHLKEFINNKKAIGRTENYTATLQNFIVKVCKECKWQYLEHITASGFESWRMKQDKAPKTLNEYLNAFNVFLKWLHKRNVIKANPLSSVEKVDGRGKESRLRRALNLEEVLRLLNVANPQHKAAYLIALTCGLRRREIELLKWSDLHLDTEFPYVMLRAITAKNRKAKPLALKPETVEAILKLKVLELDSIYIVGKLPRMRDMKADWKKANILYKDENGYIADFHSLRKTFCTFLHKAGVATRVVQEAMRHSDPKLTTNNYTDVNQFNMSEAINRLPNFGTSENGALKEASLMVSPSQSLTLTVKSKNDSKNLQVLNIEGNCQNLSSFDLENQGKKNGSGAWIRTKDQVVNSHLLYR